MYSVNDIRFFTVCVSTFRNLRVKAYLQLTAAYRSLSRLSSAPDAKAFSLCSCLLELLLSYDFTRTVRICSLFQELLSTFKTVFGLFYFISPFPQLLVRLKIVIFYP